MATGKVFDAFYFVSKRLDFLVILTDSIDIVRRNPFTFSAKGLYLGTERTNTPACCIHELIGCLHLLAYAIHRALDMLTLCINLPKTARDTVIQSKGIRHCDGLRLGHLQVRYLLLKLSYAIIILGDSTQTISRKQVTFCTQCVNLCFQGSYRTARLIHQSRGRGHLILYSGDSTDERLAGSRYPLQLITGLVLYGERIF